MIIQWRNRVGSTHIDGLLTGSMTTVGLPDATFVRRSTTLSPASVDAQF